MRPSMRKKIQYLLWATITLVTWSCSEPEFGAIRGRATEDAPDLKIASSQFCAKYTLVRPQVDLLFLWDNRTGSIFIDPKIRKALNQLVDNVSNRFDYHIMLAPLNRQSDWNVNQYARIVTYDMEGLSPAALNMRVSKKNAANFLTFPNTSGSHAPGLTRAREILANNQTNGIFRQGAYTIVVVMSSADDLSFASGYTPSESQRSIYVDSNVHDLLCLRGNYSGGYHTANHTGLYDANCSTAPSLNSSMFRYLTIAPRNWDRCLSNNVYTDSTGESGRIARTYQLASSKIYSEEYTNGNPRHRDQDGAPSMNFLGQTLTFYDNTDICRADYAGIFDGVNSVIQDTVIAHTYNHWPVAKSGASVDPQTLIVRNSNGQEFYEIPESDLIMEDTQGKNDQVGSNPVSGWRYVGVDNRPTRFLPSIGENFNGHLIQLYGQAKVTYPDCMRVTFSEEKDFYGYVHISSRPLENSIELLIDGTVIPRCGNATANHCWELMKDSAGPRYIENQNLKIASRTDFSPANPPMLRTGYFLKLRGNAIYSNSSNVNVTWLPSAN
jgi:hypothetical protein